MNNKEKQIMKEMFEEACCCMFHFQNANEHFIQFEDGSYGETFSGYNNAGEERKPEVYFKSPEDIFRELEYFVYNSDELFDPKEHESDAIELKWFKKFEKKYSHLRVKDASYSLIDNFGPSSR